MDALGKERSTTSGVQFVIPEVQQAHAAVEG